MQNVGELPIVGLTPELTTAIVDELWASFKTGYAPTRKILMDRLKANHAQLVHPRLDYTVAQVLYRLVNKGTLERRGKFYHPGPQHGAGKGA